MTIGTKINILRTRNKLSQLDLAAKLDISPTALSEIESGKTKKIDFLLMDKVCKVFEVDFEYFLENIKKFTVHKNIGGAVGDNAVINNNFPEGLLENMLKRIESLEKFSQYK